MIRRVLVGVGVLCLSGSVAVAVYYRGVAEDRDEALATAREQLAVLQAARPAVEPVGASVPVVSPPVSRSVEPAAEKMDTEELTLLQLRVGELQSALKVREATIASLQQAATNRPPDRSRGVPRGSQAWLEGLKTSDPERYARVIKGREEAKERLQGSFAGKLEFLLSRDVKDRSGQEQSNHTEMVKIMSDTWRIAQRISTEEVPREERRELMQRVHSNLTILEPTLQVERNNEWYSLGLELGYDEKEASGFAEYLNEVIKTTSVQDIYRDMRAGTFGDGGGWHGHGAPTSGVPASVTR